MSPRRSLAVVVLAALPLAAGCAAGKSSETSRERTSPYVANASAGTMLVRGALVVLSTPTSPTPTATATPTSESPSPSPSPSASGSASPSHAPRKKSPAPSPSAPSAQAYLILTIVNTGTAPDTLTNVTVPSGLVNPAGGASLTVAPQRTLQFVDPELGGSGASLQIIGLSTVPVAGTALPVTFTFQNAGTVNVQVPVRDPGTMGTTATSTPLPLTGTYPALSTEVPVSASPLPSQTTAP